LIAPGVQGTTGQAASTDDTLAWTGLTQDFGAYGKLGVNEFNLDGASYETNSRQSGVNPTIDELGETKFDVTGHEAAVGHTMGVSTTQTTKYGSNDLHGSIRETYTAKRWAAMNHFQGLNYRYQQSLAGCVHGAGTSPECFAIENQYGRPGTHMNNGSAAIGGPVYIPKIFDGHNKLFFFVSVLNDVFSGAGSQTATVPTLQERAGNFDNTYTQQNYGSDNAFQQSNTGLGLAAFLMGVNTSSSVSRNASSSLQSPYYALYAGDTWRVTPKLTIIPGLRFEYEYGVVEKHNQLIVGWDPNANLSSISGPANAAYQDAIASATPAQRAVLPSSLTIQGGPMYAGVNGAPRDEWNNSYRFLPRIAVAYQANPHLVIRGGYGLFYDTLNAPECSGRSGWFQRRDHRLYLRHLWYELCGGCFSVVKSVSG
jgi:TonB dependent receptor